MNAIERGIAHWQLNIGIITTPREVAHLAYQGWTYGIEAFKHNVQEIISEKNGTENQQLRGKVYFHAAIFSDAETQGTRYRF